MNINIWAERHHLPENGAFYYEKAIQLLIDKWSSSYPHGVFEKKTFLPCSNLKDANKFPLHYRKFIHDGHHSLFYIIIENNDTKKYFLISYWDYLNNVKTEFESRYDYTNLVEIFSGQGDYDNKNNELSLLQTEVNFTPLNKLLWVEDQDIEIQKLLRFKEKNYNLRIIPNKLHFRVGDPYGFRTYLLSDSRFDVRYGARTSAHDHVHELNKSWINMDVYSVSGVSMRLIEGMGLGTAVLSPVFPQRLHSPIIPDYHYVKVDFDESIINPSNYKKLADSYIDTFENLKRDLDKIYYISENAKQYYLEHCTLEKYVDELFSLIDLNKLI